MPKGSSRKRKASEAAAASEVDAAATDGEESRHRPGVLGRDLLKGLQDPDKFCDITLIGSDDGRVPAIRSILAMRSAVLERMLLGSFQEAQSNEVRLDFGSTVLRSVVEWCMSDTIDSFVAFQDNMGKDAGTSETKEKEVISTLQTMVETAACAHYLELKSLQQWIEVMLNKIIDEKSAFALTIWDSAMRHGAGIENVCTAALDVVRLNHTECLGLEPESSGAFLKALSPEGLHTLVKDTTLSPHAYDIFRAIETWSKVGGRSKQRERVEAAKTCASEIDLLWIPPKLLAQSVRKTGLIEDENILDAIEKYAGDDGPSCVCVFGAGVTCVNGIYKRASYQLNDAPVYEMEGEFDGRKVIFGINRDEDKEGWYLSMPKKGQKRFSGTSEDEDLYMASQRDDCDGLSENMTWSWTYAFDEEDFENAKVTVTKLSAPPKLLISPTWNTE